MNKEATRKEFAEALLRFNEMQKTELLIAMYNEVPLAEMMALSDLYHEAVKEHRTYMHSIADVMPIESLKRSVFRKLDFLVDLAEAIKTVQEKHYGPYVKPILPKLN